MSQWPAPRYEHCLVTGASAGIGEAFARALAPRARRLTITARRGDRLRRLAEALEARGPVRVATIDCDLLAPDGVERLIGRVEGEVDLLVNNAGFGRFGPIERFPWNDYEQMIQLNVTAMAGLTYALWPDLGRVPGRGVIHVASVAGFQPLPHFAVYAATKAFVRSWSLALSAEGRENGTRVLCLSPGPVATEFGEHARMSFDYPKPFMAVERVVGAALGAYARGRREVVPGLVNKVLTWGPRVLPVGLQLALARRLLSSSGG
ncbi:MAG: SDR family NAD(P)-dependent oxidoreductase [Acidobacteriota bacterium]|nr:SDR family NAD(P)-dependent oxidoreductase [Acidobacteriota bacterium]